MAYVACEAVRRRHDAPHDLGRDRRPTMAPSGLYAIRVAPAWSAGRRRTPRHGVRAPYPGARTAPHLGGPEEGLAQPSWRLPALHSPFGEKEKGTGLPGADQRTRAPSH